MCLKTDPPAKEGKLALLSIPLAHANPTVSSDHVLLRMYANSDTQSGHVSTMRSMDFVDMETTVASAIPSTIPLIAKETFF